MQYLNDNTLGNILKGMHDTTSVRSTDRTNGAAYSLNSRAIIIYNMAR